MLIILNRQTDSHPSAKPPIRSIHIRRIGGRMRINFLQSANLADGWRIEDSIAATVTTQTRPYGFSTVTGQ